MRIIILFGLLLLNTIVYAQRNLIKNGGFEEFSECCKYYGQIEAAKGWFQQGGSTDYFNTCCSDQNFLGVPYNFAGYQFPKEGNAYIGLVLFSSEDPRYKANGYYYREYIHTKLVEPLAKGKKYQVSFYYNLADSSKIFTDRFSICFSTEVKLRKYKTGEALLVAENHIFKKVGSEAKDVNDWHLVNFEYTAIGSEQFLIIGLFEKDFSKREYRRIVRSNVINEKGKNCYYYIDDVSLIQLDRKVEFSHEIK